MTVRPRIHGTNLNVGGKGIPPSALRILSARGLYQERKSWLASSTTCNANAITASSHASPNGLLSMPESYRACACVAAAVTIRSYLVPPPSSPTIQLKGTSYDPDYATGLPRKDRFRDASHPPRA